MDDQRELRVFERTAAQQGMTVDRHQDGTWSLAPAPNVEPLDPANIRPPVETYISGDRVRFADGRVFPLHMTTAELKEALGMIG